MLTQRPFILSIDLSFVPITVETGAQVVSEVRNHNGPQCDRSRSRPVDVQTAIELLRKGSHGTTREFPPNQK